MIKNTFWFRHFLMCSQLANLMMGNRGWSVSNFAQSIIESRNGRYGNDQMNIYFETADIFFCEMNGSDSDSVFDYLEEEQELSMETLAKLSKKEILEYYEKYCVGAIDFSNTIPND